MENLKANETTVNYEVILQENDPALNPANRPPINDAINMILGTAHGYEVPFAAVPLRAHQEKTRAMLIMCSNSKEMISLMI